MRLPATPVNRKLQLLVPAAMCGSNPSANTRAGGTTTPPMPIDPIRAPATRAMALRASTVSNVTAAFSGNGKSSAPSQPRYRLASAASGTPGREPVEPGGSVGVSRERGVIRVVDWLEPFIVHAVAGRDEREVAEPRVGFRPVPVLRAGRHAHDGAGRHADRRF